MKKLSLLLLTFTVVTTLISCKKEKSPELEVTVVDANDQPKVGVWVKTSVDGANKGILNSRVIDSSATDNFGKAYFKYENTVLLDVALYEGRRTTTIIDSTSILLETKRLKKGNDNVKEAKLVFR